MAGERQRPRLDLGGPCPTAGFWPSSASPSVPTLGQPPRQSPAMRMRSLIIRWEARDWEYCPDLIDVRRGIIQEFTGMSLMDWEQGVYQGDVKCLVALLWEIKHQNGESYLPMTALNFSPMAFYRSVMDAIDVALEKQRVEVDERAAVDDDGDPADTVLAERRRR